MSQFGKIEPEKIQMLRVRIVKASVEQIPDLDYVKILKGFNTSVSYKEGFNQKDKLARVELEVNVSTDTGEVTEATGVFCIHFLYHVDNLDELTAGNNGQLLVSGDLQTTLASISYSTARGILLTRFQGTIFQDFFLPVIQPGKLLEQE